MSTALEAEYKLSMSQTTSFGYMESSNTLHRQIVFIDTTFHPEVFN